MTQNQRKLTHIFGHSSLLFKAGPWMGKAFLFSALLCAAALSWGCSGLVSGQSNQTPPPPTTYSISGTISPTAGGSGATVTLGGAASATTTANSSGAYTFSGLSNGTYTVTPSLAG